ncbi:MAG: adenosine kinase [Acidimicrobiales bacterium]|nr:adenosine kinase [Acidimicrobiales bacterium]MDG1845240.1 adenosine kinase [Acidimicrobiales bacterium]
MDDMRKIYDIIGIGNAIVDVISHESDDFIERHGLIKDSMALVDEETATGLYNDMHPAIQTSGGSAANTMAGIASLGGSAAYIGKVRNDHLGDLFAHDIEASGVDYLVDPATIGLPTARSMVLVTPDGARTMSTFLGASSTLYPHDIDAENISTAEYLYCEGYIWDVEITKEAIRLAMSIAKEANKKVCFTLSDSFCVHRHRQEWLELVAGPVDILFANKDEICALSGYESFDKAINWIRGQVGIACLTEAENGSTIVTADETIKVEAFPVDKVVDSTGAGDLYAAGFLHGLIKGHDLETCGKIGSLVAAKVVAQTGARFQTSLSEIVSNVFNL